MNPSTEDDDIVDVVPDKEVLPSLLAYQCLDVLSKSDEAAYRVFLSLACKFGAGQRI